METKFITLTTSSKFKTYINPVLIAILDPYKNSTTISMMGGQTITVTESVDEILKMIKKTESFTIKYD